MASDCSPPRKQGNRETAMPTLNYLAEFNVNLERRRLLRAEGGSHLDLALPMLAAPATKSFAERLQNS